MSLINGMDKLGREDVEMSVKKNVDACRTDRLVGEIFSWDQLRARKWPEGGLIDILTYSK